MKKITLIIPAAGSGKRMNIDRNKIFLEINGKTILEMVLEKFSSFDEIIQTIVIIRREDEELFKKIFTEFNVEYVYGGEERQDSISNAIDILNIESEYVMVHDGARPLIKKEFIKKIIDKVSKNTGVILAVKSKDTVKRVKDLKVVETLDRSEIFNVQTPQIFYKENFVEVYNKLKQDKIMVTDDSSLFEYFGYEVGVVIGDYSNIKITTLEDLDFLEFFLTKNV